MLSGDNSSCPSSQLGSTLKAEISFFVEPFFYGEQDIVVTTSVRCMYMCSCICLDLYGP